MDAVTTPWLVPPSARRESPDRYREGDSRIEPVEAIVLHYTASRSFAGTSRWLSKADQHYVSAHFVVARDGRRQQLVNLNERAWHAGGRTSRLFERGRVNFRTIGIEMMNLGPLTLEPDGSLSDWTGRSFDGAVAWCEDDVHGPWEAYGARQIAATIDLCRELQAIFPVLTRDTDRIQGHDEIDPTRKRDPGPAFPWAMVHRTLFPDMVEG